MLEFNDNEYSEMISEIIHDLRYIKQSNRGKIATIRRYAEVLSRKILNIGSDNKFDLGKISNTKIFNKNINRLESNLREYFLVCVEKIRPTGNDGTHTQHTAMFLDEQVLEMEDALLDLYSVLFIKFFNSYKVDLNFSPNSLFLFSLMPPVVRYKVWKFLYKFDKNNIIVVDKLCLSIIKTKNKGLAIEWLNKNSVDLKNIPYPTQQERKDYLRSRMLAQRSSQVFFSLDFDKYDNIYDLLKEKIENSNTSINEAGKLYGNFEEALNYYKRIIPHYVNNNLFENDKALTEINELIQFTYIGVKS